MNWLVTEVSSVSLFVCAVNYINSVKTLSIQNFYSYWGCLLVYESSTALWSLCAGIMVVTWRQSWSITEKRSAAGGTLKCKQEANEENRRWFLITGLNNSFISYLSIKNTFICLMFNLYHHVQFVYTLIILLKLSVILVHLIKMFIIHEMMTDCSLITHIRAIKLNWINSLNSSKWRIN